MPYSCKIIAANHSQQQARPEDLPKKSKTSTFLEKWWQAPGVENFTVNFSCHFISYVLTYLQGACFRFHTGFCYSDCKRSLLSKRKEARKEFLCELGTCCCPRNKYFWTFLRFESQPFSTSKKHIMSDEGGGSL